MPSITGKTSCYRGPGFIDDLLLVKLVSYITSNIITAESTGSTPIPALIESESADEQARRNPSRNPTNQAMSTWESQRTKVESSWQVRGNPLLAFSFEDMMRRDADKDCEQVFNVTWSKWIWQPGDTRSQILSPSAKAESPRQPTVMQRNSDDKLNFF